MQEVLYEKGIKGNEYQRNQRGWTIVNKVDTKKENIKEKVKF